MDREVNVVKVEFTAGRGADNKIDYEPQDPFQDPVNLIRILSSGEGENTMVAFLNVKKITGPVVNNQMRGVKFVEAGFIQNFSIPAGFFRGQYPFMPNTKYRVNKAYEGKSFLDGSGAYNPWYDAAGESASDVPPNKADNRGVYPNDISPVTDPEVTNKFLVIADSPGVPVVDSMILDAQGNPLM